MRQSIKLIFSLMSLILIHGLMNAVIIDDFNDNIGDTNIWHYYQQSTDVFLLESNQQLELRTKGIVNTTDGYTSAFATIGTISLLDDFTITVDYTHTPSAGTTGIGVGLIDLADLTDPFTLSFFAGNDSNTDFFGASASEGGSIFFQDDWSRSLDSGVLSLDYNASVDSLSVIANGTSFKTVNSFQSLLGINELNVFLNGIVVNGSVAESTSYLDNFDIEGNFTTNVVPEPMTMGLFSLSGILLAFFRKKVH